MREIIRAGGVGILLSLAALGSNPNPTWAATIAITAGRDNTLYQDPTGSLSNGAGQYLFAGTTAMNSIRRGLVWFDLSAIPAGATINNATLTLHMSQSTAGTLNVELHRLLADWGEGASIAPGGEGGGGPAAPGDATWIHTFYNTSFWTNPGGDFDPTASAIAAVGAVGSYSWTSAGMAGDVQNWLSSPGINFGWLIEGDETLASTAKRFDSRNNVTESFRPVLLVEYTAVPGPGGVTMFLIGPALLWRGRHRRMPR